MKLFDETIRSLENSMHHSTRTNNVISDNIANVDTPNYKAKHVAFKDVLHDESSKLQLKQTKLQHIPSSDSSHSHRIVTNPHTTYNHNGNNVDIDKEMSDLAENQIYYRSLVDRLNGKFQTLQTVLRGGK